MQCCGQVTRDIDRHLGASERLFITNPNLSDVSSCPPLSGRDAVLLVRNQCLFSRIGCDRLEDCGVSLEDCQLPLGQPPIITTTMKQKNGCRLPRRYCRDEPHAIVSSNWQSALHPSISLWKLRKADESAISKTSSGLFPGCLFLSEQQRDYLA